MRARDPLVVVDVEKLWTAIDAELARTGMRREDLAEQVGVTVQVVYDIRAAALRVPRRRNRPSGNPYQPGGEVLLSICWWLARKPTDFQLVRYPSAAPGVAP